MGRLEGKVAVITGAGRGIGRATALRFADEGATLALNDLDSDPLDETLEAVHARGAKAVGTMDDSVDFEAARALMAGAIEAFGRIDIHVNNAGTTRDRMFHSMDLDDWALVLAANLDTAVNCARAAIDHMRAEAKAEKAATGAPAHHRKITFTTSIAAMRPDAGQANYATAKSAIIGLTKALARELGPFHINVNAVAPGFIDTRLTAEPSGEAPVGLSRDVRDAALAQTALGRFGSPEDMASAHVFLASDEADFISGAVLPVSGGLLGV